MFSWDNKQSGYQVLLAKLFDDDQYKNSVQNYAEHMLNSETKTPKGLIWLQQWGPNRYAANAAFLLLQAAEILEEQKYADLGMDQLRV